MTFSAWQLVGLVAQARDGRGDGSTASPADAECPPASRTEPSRGRSGARMRAVLGADSADPADQPADAGRRSRRGRRHRGRHVGGRARRVGQHGARRAWSAASGAHPGEVAGRRPQAGRLPTERQLSIDLGVTRSSVRSALALLEAQGHISREVGRGTFLRELPRPVQGGGGTAGQLGSQWGRCAASRLAAGRAGRRHADFAPADVMTVRRLLEPPAMVLVVAWATAADLEEMDRCIGTR